MSITIGDEKRFCVDGLGVSARYWEDTRLGEIISSRARDGQGIMIWAAISKKGKYKIVLVGSNNNAQALTPMLTKTFH